MMHRLPDPAPNAASFRASATGRSPFASAFAITLALGLAGCATVTTRIQPRNVSEDRAVRQLTRDPESAARPAALALAPGRVGSAGPDARLADFTEAARLSFDAALRGDAEARTIYDAALRGLVDAMARAGFADAELPRGAAVRSVRVERAGPDVLDPARAALLVPADQVRVGRLHERATAPGFGLPYVAWFPAGDPFLVGEPGVPATGMSVPVTAALEFRDGACTLRFFRTLRVDRARLGGRTVRLAGDFTAPLAVTLSRGRNRSLDLGAMLFTDRLIDRKGLFQFQPYDPAKIPVVFVHGLMSRPEAWTQATNSLLADPEIRARYQFWFLLYPTGLPVWATAAALRAELDRFDRELAAHRRGDPPDLVLVGHSMGGLVSNLMIREGGQALWSRFSDVPFDQTELPPDVAPAIRGLIDFRPRPDVARVIFVATPHRGSPLALRPIASFAANLVRLPLQTFSRNRQFVLPLLREDVRRLFYAPANSIRFLRADSPLVTSILELPAADVPKHSIIGDRGRVRPLERSSDGIVPYSSSHLPSAASEKIIPSGHGANEHPLGIAEIRRILLLHLHPSQNPRPPAPQITPAK